MDDVMEKLMEIFMRAPKVEKEYVLNRIGFSFYDNNATAYKLDGKTITKFFGLASVKDGRKIDTRFAKRKKIIEKTEGDKKILSVVYEQNKLKFTQEFVVEGNNNYFVATAKVEDLKGETISNYIAPLDFAYPDKDCDPLFLSLDQKMYLVPYDNDMWVRYESTPLRPGRTSYDLTAIYNDDTNIGLIVGALDFDIWKNAIKCSQIDARCYTAFSGVADECTHDVYPHGYLQGKEVQSARFLCGWYDDILDGLEVYGKVAMEGKFAFKWNHPVPFGWNCYSAGAMSLEQWNEAGKFIQASLNNFKDSEGYTYINLDGNFMMLNQKKMKAIVKEMHDRGQKCGAYMAPLLGIEGLGKFIPLKGSFGKNYEDVIMRHSDGSFFSKIDGGKPVDATIPAMEKHIRTSIREIVDLGFDYVKIDFLAHGSVEGERFNKDIKTGRQAMDFFYKILAEELDPQKIGRDIFVDLSIAPVFPGGFGHARRCCCDAFGHHEDVRYVLNSLNYAWWQSGTLYCYNDPDHTVLYESKVDGRGPTDENSARSRYNASVISGTVVLLSDNYGPGDGDNIKNAKARAEQFANNEKLNSIARLGVPFRPVCIKSDTTNIYYLNYQDKKYVAFFNFNKDKQIVSVDSQKVKMPASGTFVNLNTDKSYKYKDIISLELEGFDSAILEIQ